MDEEFVLSDRTLRDVIRAHGRRLAAQRNHYVVPTRVRRLCNIGRGRVGVGMRVRVEHADDRSSLFFRGAIGADLIGRINDIATCRCGGVARRVPTIDRTIGTGGSQKSASFFRVTNKAVSNDVVAHL